MLNLITVAFREEFAVLKVQAQSIDKFIQPQMVDRILVIINDDSPVSSVDPAWWGQFSDRVQVISRHTFSNHFSTNGWHSQQLLKLLGASICYNTWSWILDAKTLFVRALTEQDLFDSDQRAMVGRPWMGPEVFRPSHDTVEKLFGINFDTHLPPGGVPFFFHNATVRSMISQIERITNTSFDRWFQSQPQLTEFILYSGFVLVEHGDYSKLYNTDRCGTRPVNLAHNELELIEEKFFQMNEPFTSTVSIHRWAWSNISLQHQQQYRDFLSTKGITCEL